MDRKYIINYFHLLLLLCSLLFVSCKFKKEPDGEPITNSLPPEVVDVKDDKLEIKIEENRRLRYLYFANGGLIGYFDDGTISGCPRCDFNKENVQELLTEKPHSTYVIQDDGSLLIGGEYEEHPTEEQEAGYGGWAMVNYKWIAKPISMYDDPNITIVDE